MERRANADHSQREGRHTPPAARAYPMTRRGHLDPGSLHTTAMSRHPPHRPCSAPVSRETPASRSLVPTVPPLQGTRARSCRLGRLHVRVSQKQLELIDDEIGTRDEGMVAGRKLDEPLRTSSINALQDDRRTAVLFGTRCTSNPPRASPRTRPGSRKPPWIETYLGPRLRTGGRHRRLAGIAARSRARRRAAASATRPPDAGSAVSPHEGSATARLMIPVRSRRRSAVGFHHHAPSRTNAPCANTTSTATPFRADPSRLDVATIT